MRTLARLLALVPLLVAAAFFAWVVTAPASVSGVAYASSLLLVTAALLFERTETRRRIRVVGAGLLALTVGSRVAFAEHGRGLRMGTPTEHDARWIDRVIDEEDLAVNGARMVGWTAFAHDPDVPSLAHVMHVAYARMRAEQGSTPSPVVATYIGLEAPGADDTLEIGDVEHAAGVVVFLHGYAGSFTLPCWVVSRAARDAGFATVCPSTRWVGDWWSPAGEATLRETVSGLHGRGVREIVLAGLSNGGIGASLLAPRMRGTFDGLIVISGASPEAAAPGVPVLALHGTHDAQISADVVRAYAGRVDGRYLAFDAGHFAMLTREQEMMPAITSFLRERASRTSTGARTSAREVRP